ncbi:MAG: HAD-IIB family hydrolase [Candidatus Hydrogenedentes bacterium]|nr:HAD-IIB family hydrolase [Candidatus Hydrogenedentota bacterium]
MADGGGRLYVSDLDGTLLRNDATVSEFSCRHLNELINRGMQFTVASARSVVSMGYVLRGVRIALPVIEFNGAFISDLQTGYHHVVNSIARDTVDELYGLILRQGMRPFVSCVDDTQDDLLFYDEAINEGMQRHVDEKLRMADRRLRRTDALHETLLYRVVCLTVMDRRGPLEALLAEIVQTCRGSIEPHLFENPYQAGWYWLTLHDTKATKDQAIRALAENFGIAASQLTVFGDHMNDLGMFRIASHAVAVGNAKEELKQHATCVIGTNEEDSVVRYLVEHSGLGDLEQVDAAPHRPHPL